MSRAKVITTALVAAGALLAPATGAQAAGYDCDASALRVSILGGTALEPLVANRNVGTCLNADKTLVSLPKELPLLGAELAAAVTRITGDTMQNQRVMSVGGLAHLKVKVLPELPIALPTPVLTEQMQAVDIPIASPLSLILGTDKITVDLRPAINSLLPNGKLPNADVVEATIAQASATAGCVNGRVELAGASNVLGLKILGQEIPTDAIVEQVVSLADSRNIDVSKIDLSKVVLPQGLSFTTPGVGPLLQAAIKPVLDAVPDIKIPETLALVKITPNEQIREANKLTQRALRVQVGLLNQSLVDAVVGEAVVREDSVSCTVEPPALQCTKRRLVLTDVYPKGRRVQLEGVADKAFIGKRVDIVFRASEKVVARPTVQPDGSFSATASMPRKGLRGTNDARYQARLGREKSLDLKLMRRMVVDEMSSRDGKVTIVGHLTGPLPKRLDDVLIKRRISCSKSVTAGAVRPDKNGRFRVVVDAPADTTAAVYRLESKVLKVKSNPKKFKTYTLPRGVNLL